MAKKGTSKRRSVDQEDRLARAYNGKRSRSSGASDHDQGDVRTCCRLIEAKTTGTPIKPAKSISVKVDDLEKAMVEAASEGRTMAFALSIHNPESVLANASGDIDLILYRVADDSARDGCFCQGEAVGG